MKFMREACIIFGITMAGELLNRILPLPVPAGVYGLFILLALLCAGVVKLPDVEECGSFLLDVMPLMFIPVSAGLLESFHEIRPVLAPVLAVTAVSTVTVMAVTGKVAEFIMKKTKKGNE